MKKYTQEEFDALPVDEFGYKRCPTGDYTAIKEFPCKCIFLYSCTFTSDCKFGESCSFGNRCRFGKRCKFMYWCSFGNCCTFMKGCNFAGSSSFGACCYFHNQCVFGYDCSFGEFCEFYNCICEFGEFLEMISFGGFGSDHRTTYAFKLNDGGIGIRCGCFAGNLEEFKNKVKETHGDTKLAKEYLMVADLIEFKFKE